MARENFVLKTLLEKGEVIWNPKGNSMTPKIQSGDQVTVKQVPIKAYRVGDIVYAKVKGNYYLHLLSATDDYKSITRYQISNNHGYVNGWISEFNLYGLCVKVGEKTLITDEDLKNRLGIS